MKTPTITALSILLSASICFSQDLPKWDKLTLKNGREYEKVKVTEKRPDGVSITHDSGTARIKFEDLPDAVVTQLGGFKPEDAAKARAETDAKEAAARAEIDRGMAAQGPSVTGGKDPATKPSAKSKLALMKVMQAPGDGNALCHVLWVTTGSNGFRSCYGDFDGAPEYIHGIGDVVDDQIVSAALVPAENHTYTTTTGAKSTVKSWTVSGRVGDGKGIVRQSPGYNPPVSSSQSVGGG